MEAFHDQLLNWTSFYSATAQVSGTLVGLVFVALTFRPKSLGDDGDPVLRQLARQTFSDFVKVLMVSLMMLVPYATPGGTGLTVLLIAAVDIVQLGRRLLELRGQEHRMPGNVNRRFYLSMAANLGMVAAAVMFLRLAPGAIGGWSILFACMIVLLISGSRSAWLLLVHRDEG